MDSRFLIRLDDICPTMDHRRFTHVSEVLHRHRVPALIGVVPDNRDPALCVSAPDPRFWERIGELVEQHGWTVAQHGYQHLYRTGESGTLGIGSKSEFAGRPYLEQEADLRRGRALLRERGLDTNVFMAPSHSFDENTLRALRVLGFRYVTDGFGLFPYREAGLTFVPQLFRSPYHFGVGVYTLCLHLNTIPAPKLSEILRFVENRPDRFVSFRRVAEEAGPPTRTTRSLALITRYSLRLARWVAQVPKKAKTS